jgi:HEAT repeat protein
LSECADERRLGVDILSQLGEPERPFPEESLGLLSRLAATEIDCGVLAAVASALGFLNHAGALGPLLSLKRHPDWQVRHGVACALSGNDHPKAVEALIELSTDEDADIRDWATFGLGTQIELDTPAIRTALAARLVDGDAVTRAEAMVGLARRKDGRVLRPLLEALRPERIGDYEPRVDLVIESAETLADPRLLPALYRVRARWGDNQFDDAIRACGGAC